MNDTNTATVNPAADTQAIETKQPEYGVFHGRYAYASGSVYEFLTKQYGMQPETAHRISHQVACDFGGAMKSERTKSEVSHKIGKAGKEGMLSLREALVTTIKGVPQTFPLRLAHAIQWLSDAGSHYVSYGNTTWQFDAPLSEWLTKQTA